jgi:hypothetical protein
MKIEAELTDDQLDEIVRIRLDHLADNMEDYLHRAEVPLKDDIKDYKMLVKAANYFKVPNEQRKPLKFVAGEGSLHILRKKRRNHKEDVLYSEAGHDPGSAWQHWGSEE